LLLILYLLIIPAIGLTQIKGLEENHFCDFQLLLRSSYVVSATYQKNQFDSKHFYMQQLINDSVPSHGIEYDYYLKKSKSQKTGAWILLGLGVTSTVIGLIGLHQSNNYDPNSYFAGMSGNTGSSTSGTILTVVGLSMTGGSIPLFIASNKNKRKAEWYLSNQK
jgi:hypothetical protein